MSHRKLVVLSFALVALLCASAYANDFEPRGSAVVGGLSANYYDSTRYWISYLYVTNVSGVAVDCRVTAYDYDGQDVTNYCSVYTGSPSGPSPVLVTSGSGSFELPAGESRYVRLGISTSDRCIIGHAVIEWSSDEPHVQKSLIVVGGRYCRNGNYAREILLPVIGSQPF